MHSTNRACFSYFHHRICSHAGAKTSLQVLATFIDDSIYWGKHTALPSGQGQQLSFCSMCKSAAVAWQRIFCPAEQQHSRPGHLHCAPLNKQQCLGSAVAVDCKHFWYNLGESSVCCGMLPLLSNIYTALFRFKHGYFMNLCQLTARCICTHICSCDHQLGCIIVYFRLT